MNAVDEIQAAIDALTEYKLRGYSIDNGWLIEVDDTVTYPDDPRMPLTNDEYMVTLHRTIDAQLAILRGVLTRPVVTLDMREYDVAALTLARAINGTNA